MTNEAATAEAEEAAPAVEIIQIPEEIVDIFKFLSKNGNIIFKSQQIDDPELCADEKMEIARQIYVKSRRTFLLRFGGFMEKNHLETFARLAVADENTLISDEEFDELQFTLRYFHHKLKTRRQEVKNRRYTALQQLIEKGEYFSEGEMMKRSPELYDELIGQYLSEAEIKQRDSYDVKNTSFSGILMHTLEKQQRDDLFNAKLETPEDDEQSEMYSSRSSDSDVIVKDDFSFDPPQVFRQQWGNFENENVACSTSHVTLAKCPNEKLEKSQPTKLKRHRDKFITAGERDILRNEFIGIMHANFLNGDDKDFDYVQVDDNAEMDDLKQLNQDKEDVYFEASDDDDDDADNKEGELEVIVCMNESDDELDIFMRHLNKHHSLQKQSNGI